MKKEKNRLENGIEYSVHKNLLKQTNLWTGQKENFGVKNQEYRLYYPWNKNYYYNSEKNSRLRFGSKLSQTLKSFYWFMVNEFNGLAKESGIEQKKVIKLIGNLVSKH